MKSASSRIRSAARRCRSLAGNLATSAVPLAIAAATVLATSAQAQGLTPPRADGELGTGWGTTAVRMIAFLVLFGLVSLAATFPSKRGHQD